MVGDVISISPTRSYVTGTLIADSTLASISGISTYGIYMLRSIQMIDTCLDSLISHKFVLNE